MSRDEILAHFTLVRQDVKGVLDRLESLDGRTREAEQAIAVLTDRGARSVKTAGTWGASAGAVIGGALWAIREWLGK